MRPTFNGRRRLRKMVLALAALCAASVAAPTALAQGNGEGNGGVIVASSSPGNAVGRIVRIGQALRLEPGASVTILEEGGRVSTIVRSGVFRAAAAPRARSGPSMIESVSALVGSDRSVRTPGGVRNLEEERRCAAGAVETSVLGLQRALDARCDAQAASIIDSLVETAGPPQLYVGLLHSREARGRVIGIAVQANFEAHLYCRVRRADSTLAAVTPEPGALPMRVVASSSYNFVFPTSETAGAVQCVAIGARAGAPAPDVGDWPRELDPERAERNARVASVLLPIDH